MQATSAIKKKIMIAVPAYTGMVHLATARAMLIDILGMAELGWMVDIREVAGCADIAHARNEIVAHFLASDATDLVFIDADVAWEPGALVKLAGYPVDVVAGVYRGRADPETYCIRWAQEHQQLISNRETGLLEVEAVPAGFLRISRTAAERVTRAYPDVCYPNPNQADKTAPPIICGMFDQLRQDGVRYGEDFSFCLRWRALGGKVWIDPRLTLHHIGNKTFTGNIGEWLKARPPAVAPAA